MGGRRGRERYNSEWRERRGKRMMEGKRDEMDVGRRLEEERKINKDRKEREKGNESREKEGKLRQKKMNNFGGKMEE